MNAKKRKLVVTLASSALLAGGAVTGADKTPAQSPAKVPAIAAAKLAAMNKAELKKLLVRVVEEKAPAPKMGAMCYSPMPLSPEGMQYVCPNCGEKTMHSKEVSWAWAHELDACRRILKLIPRRETMALDKSSFCKKCQPQASALRLNLTIRFDDGTSHTTQKITSQDLRLLRDFLGGKLLVAGPTDDESPLKNQLPRLRQLLGLKDE